MIESKVIIVGGGPAGSSCAWKLKQSGVECLILEQKEFPREKLCGGLFAPSVLHKLEIDLIDYPHSLLTFDSLDIHIFGVKLRVKGTIYSIRRYEFDHWLLMRSGVPVKTHKIRNIRKDDDYYIIDDLYRCQYLIGAGGTHCPVYKTFFKYSYPRRPSSLIATMEQELPYKWRDKRCLIWFFEKSFPGYSWYIPKANGYLTIGLGGHLEELKKNNDNIKTHWNHFLRKLKSLSLVNNCDFNAKGAIYYLKNDLETGRVDNAFIIGDAAGIATMDMGEGIYPAVKSGIMAAQAIVNGTEYSLEYLPKYSLGLMTGKLLEVCLGINAAIAKIKSTMR